MSITAIKIKLLIRRIGLVRWVLRNIAGRYEISVVNGIFRVVTAASHWISLVSPVIIDHTWIVSCRRVLRRLLLHSFFLEGVSFPDAIENSLVFVLKLLYFLFEVVELLGEINPFLFADLYLLLLVIILLHLLSPFEFFLYNQQDIYSVKSHKNHPF